MFLGNEFTTDQVFGVPPLPAYKSLKKTCLATVVDLLGRKTGWVQDVQFTYIGSPKNKWLEFGSANTLMAGDK